MTIANGKVPLSGEALAAGPATGGAVGEHVDAFGTRPSEGRYPYLATGARVALMRMYATDATLRLGVSHARALVPDILDFVARTGFEAERVTTLTADWDDAPAACLARTTKVVLTRNSL